MISSTPKIAIMSFIGAALLTGCQAGDAVAPTETPATDTSLPDFTGSGSEPFWNMLWQGQTLVVTIAPDDTEMRHTALDVEPTSEGWSLTGSDGLTVTIKNTGCVDMAEERHDYAVDAMVQGRRLVGCANPV